MFKNVCRLVTSIIIFLSLFNSMVFASSQQAYKDYIYEFDQYRTKNTIFLDNRDEYEKFKTLVSENKVIESSKNMMIRRDILFKSYLSLLIEKINENPGLVPEDKNSLLSSIQTKNDFLNNHQLTINSISNLNDIKLKGKDFSTFYPDFLLASNRITVSIAIGNLIYYQKNIVQKYELLITQINLNRHQITPKKQEIINNWVSTIAERIKQFQEKLDIIKQNNINLTALFNNDSMEYLNDASTQLADASQLLTTISANLLEVMDIMKN
jgi:hypothetical protein